MFYLKYKYIYFGPMLLSFFQQPTYVWFAVADLLCSKEREVLEIAILFG